MYVDVNSNNPHNMKKLKILQLDTLRVQKLRHKTYMLIS